MPIIESGLSPWTDDLIAILKAEWADGQSAAQISRTLNCGLSRNAVIGKIFRLGLISPNAKQGKGRSTLPRMPRFKIVPSFEPQKVELPKPDAIGPWDDFPKAGCLFIEQSPASEPWRCCGHECEKEKRFCPYHWALTHRRYQPNGTTNPEFTPLTLSEEEYAPPSALHKTLYAKKFGVHGGIASGFARRAKRA